MVLRHMGLAEAGQGPPVSSDVSRESGDESHLGTAPEGHGSDLKCLRKKAIIGVEEQQILGVRCTPPGVASGSHARILLSHSVYSLVASGNFKGVVFGPVVDHDDFCRRE